MAQLGNFGQTLRLRFVTDAGAAVDIRGAELLEVRFELRGATVPTRWARTGPAGDVDFEVDGEDGWITYTIQSDDWSDVGEVYVQGHAFKDGDWRYFTVLAKLVDVLANIEVAA